MLEQIFVPNIMGPFGRKIFIGPNLLGKGQNCKLAIAPQLLIS